MFYKMFSLIENSYVAYTAVVLEPESSQFLLDKFRDLVPEGWKKYAHHMTINMKTINDGPANGLLGYKTTLKVVSYAKNDKVLAVEVQTDVPSENKIKHVTIATSPTGKPGESNDLTDWIRLQEVIILHGTVEEVQGVGEAPKPKLLAPPTPPSPDTPEEFIKFLKAKPLNIIKIALRNKFPGVFFSDEQIQAIINKDVEDKQ